MTEKRWLLGLTILIASLVLSACGADPARSARRMFEDLHAASVYYVAQDETAIELGNRSSGDVVVKACYEIRRDVGAPFAQECAYVTMQEIDGKWTAVLMYDGDRADNGCWTPLVPGQEILASSDWLDRDDEALAALDCP